MIKKLFASAMLITVSIIVNASTNKELKYDLNESGSQYIKLNVWTQAWIRYNENNPGSLVNNQYAPQSFDIGLRRTRIQMSSQINEFAYLYVQVGVNNLAYNSPRKQAIFFHDVVGELKVVDRTLNIGTGLTGFSGLSRYTAPSSTSILSMDVPLYKKVNKDVNDQFGRNLSVYAKGKIEKIDYRLIASKPMSIDKGSVGQASISSKTNYALGKESMKLHGYVNYQFRDQESNQNPYFAGTYLGSKNVFNVGVGFMSQKQAMWSQTALLDTSYYNMNLYNIDVFYEKPINASYKNAITFYGAVSYYDLGPKYYRNIAPMNPATGINPRKSSVNGAGNGAPIIGTGTNSYAQIAYLFKENLLGKFGTIQPYYTQQYSVLKAFDKPVSVIDLGLNWYLSKQNSKITFNYQNRPIFKEEIGQLPTIGTHKGSYTLQLQLFL